MTEAPVGDGQLYARTALEREALEWMDWHDKYHQLVAHRGLTPTTMVDGTPPPQLRSKDSREAFLDAFVARHNSAVTVFTLRDMARAWREAFFAVLNEA
jgi:hypothetical protein